MVADHGRLAVGGWGWLMMVWRRSDGGRRRHRSVRAATWVLVTTLVGTRLVSIRVSAGGGLSLDTHDCSRHAALGALHLGVLVGSDFGPPAAHRVKEPGLYQGFAKRF